MTEVQITSGDNARLRLVRKLANKRFRDETGRFVVEGDNLVREAVSRGADVEFLLLRGGTDGPGAGLPLPPSVPVYSVLPSLFDRLTDAEHGIDRIAVVRKPVVTAETVALASADGGNILVLDRVQDPGNVGGLIRTAAAAGYRAVVCIKGTGDVYSPKVLRSTAGTVYALPILHVDSAAQAVELAASLGKRFAVTVPCGGTSYTDVDLSRDVALVIGNEGRGVSDEIMAAADILITIPMRNGVESLNATVSGSILMYESIRNCNNQ